MKNRKSNIVIADESALFFYEHIASLEIFSVVKKKFDPFENSGRQEIDFAGFNPSHPLYGGMPVTVLVGKLSDRKQSREVNCKVLGLEVSAGSFCEIRDGLYVTTPELLFARMGNCVSEVRLAEIGMTLCSRYWIDAGSSGIRQRRQVLTTPLKLQRYVEKNQSVRGSKKAMRALRWVFANSGSPLETKMMLQFSLPLCRGGFGLPFDAMNYDVSAGRLAGCMEQSQFCLDCVNTQAKIALEYDGENYHADAAHDKRRRNSINVLGWRVYPIDKSVLYDPEATKTTALQLSRLFGRRIRFPECWDESFIKLRRDLGLPVNPSK